MYFITIILLTLYSPIIFANDFSPDIVDDSVIVTNTNDDNLWNYIDNRAKLKFDNKKITNYMSWFVNNPGYLSRVSVRAEPYLYFIIKEVQRRKMPIEIALLPIVESAFYPFAYSSQTASGLWQFIPNTGLFYGLEQNWWYDARRDINSSTIAALQYLENLHNLFEGDWLLAIAAYNAGPGRVRKAIRKNKKLNLATDFWSLDLPSETTAYVPKLLAVREIIRNPSKYNQQLKFIKNEQAIDYINIKSQLNIKKISQLSGVSINKIYNLNPGINRWITPPIANYKLVLPIDSITKFKKKLAALPLISQLEWVRHKVSVGEKLPDIANAYSVSEDNLQSINRLDNSITKSGDFIIVPILKQYHSYHSLTDTQKQQRLQQQRLKENIQHTIINGDSLWKIAKLYQVSIANLMSWNNITNANFIKIGSKLLIKSSYDVNNALNNSDISTKINITRKILYNIKKNDSLSELAQRFNVSIANIKKWNNLDSNLIKYGSNLIIYINLVQ